MTDEQRRARIKRIRAVAHFVRAVPDEHPREPVELPEVPTTAVPFTDLEEAFFRKPLGAA